MSIPISDGREDEIPMPEPETELDIISITRIVHSSDPAR